MASSSSTVEITYPPAGGRSQSVPASSRTTLASSSSRSTTLTVRVIERAGIGPAAQPLDGCQVWGVPQLRGAAAPDMRDDDQRLGRLRWIDRQGAAVVPQLEAA